MRCRDCGRPLDECSDPERDWYPQRTICYATREREAATALYAEIHQERPFHDGTETLWASQRSRATPYHFSEGVRIYVADVDVNPDDQFLTPSGAGAKEAPGNEAQAHGPGDHPS